MKILLVLLTIFMLWGCSDRVGPSHRATNSLSQNSNQPNPSADECPEIPPGTLEEKNVKSISLESKPTNLSGQIRAGKSIGYAFEAKAGQQLEYKTKEPLCLWVYTPDNQLLSGTDISQNGKYTLQVSAPKGSTTFNLKISLNTISAANPVIPAPQPVPLPSQVVINTQQVQFSKGSTGAAIRGNLTSGKRDRHLLGCAGGQLMSIQIQEGSVKIVIVDPNGQIIGTVENGQSQWQGRLPSNGDYAVEVSSSNNSSYTIYVEVL